MKGRLGFLSICAVAAVVGCGPGAGGPRSRDASADAPDAPRPSNGGDAPAGDEVVTANGADVAMDRGAAGTGGSAAVDASTDEQPTGDVPQATSCSTSASCGASRWCNPATGLCEDRQRAPQTKFVEDVLPVFTRGECLYCHLDPGELGAAPLQDGLPLLFNGFPPDIYGRLVTKSGTTCAGNERRVCVDEPKESLLVTRIVTLPGVTPGLGQHTYDGWANADIQTLLRWVAEGAPYDGPDGGVDATAGEGPAEDAAPDAQPNADAAPSEPMPTPPPCDSTHDPAVEQLRRRRELRRVRVARRRRRDGHRHARPRPSAPSRPRCPSPRPAEKKLLACAGAAPYAEAIAVGPELDGTAIYGGFSCSNWAYSGTKIRLRPATSPALRVHDLRTGFKLHDADVAAPDATAPGASSVAALVANSPGVELMRVSLTARQGRQRRQRGARRRRHRAGAPRDRSGQRLEPVLREHLPHVSDRGAWAASARASAASRHAEATAAETQAGSAVAARRPRRLVRPIPARAVTACRIATSASRPTSRAWWASRGSQACPAAPARAPRAPGRSSPPDGRG